MKYSTMKSEAVMSKRELIARELDHIPEQDLDKLLAFLEGSGNHTSKPRCPW